MVATASNPRTYHVSASSIRAFKDCPTRFRLGYREGLRVIEDTESQRYGNAWHGMHETYANAYNGIAESFSDGWTKERCHEFAMAEALKYLSERYERVPNGKTAAEWKLEFQILATCFMGYHWYYQNDPIEFLASELPFNLPLHLPNTGLPLPMSEVQRVGKIDHVIRWQGAVCALERKSTSRAISDDSDYWEKARKDTQVSMYALAFKDMLQQEGQSWLRMTSNDIEVDGGRYGNTLYDVWHRPTIKPAPLTQKETRDFVETNTYRGVEFVVKANVRSDDFTQAVEVLVDGENAEIDQGKKGFAIKETVGMYSARLMQDIYARPEFYFRRKEISRTDQDLQHFRGQLFAVYQNQKAAEKYGCWIENEAACRATFPCPYLKICYGPGADAVCDGKTTPDGYKRIFVDLTVNGNPVEAEE